MTEVDAQWYRSQIGVVMQDPRLFSNTITANITYGCTGKSQVGPLAGAQWVKPSSGTLSFEAMPRVGLALRCSVLGQYIFALRLALRFVLSFKGWCADLQIIGLKLPPGDV